MKKIAALGMSILLSCFLAGCSQPKEAMAQEIVIPIGKVTSDLSVFDQLGGREEITFSLAE